MGIRRVVSLSMGAALGAGAMYLLDPEHGEARRRAARQRALAQARHGTSRALRDLREQAQGVTLAALDGYQRSRSDASGDREPHSRSDRRSVGSTGS